MPFAFEDSPKGHERLNGFLAAHSFLTGYQPSPDDANVFKAFKSPPASKNTHILRWYNNINSYSPAERSNFGKTVTNDAPVCPMPAKSAPAPAANDDDDDVDLFASDEEESKEAAAIREKRLKDYADKKSKKPVLIAKSSIVLDIKPWDDETDMREMEKMVRAIEMDGLVWGASKLVPVGYGIHKLQIMCVVEDEKVSIDLLSETIQECEELVQSVDIAAFNKI